MAIVSVSGFGNAKQACGLLAGAILKSMTSTTFDSTQHNRTAPVINAIRLLEMYRHNLFPNESPQGILMRSRLNSSLSADDSKRASFIPVREALEAAREEVFDKSIGETVDELEKALLSMRKKAPNFTQDQELFKKTRKFFQSFADHLTEKNSIASPS